MFCYSPCVLRRTGEVFFDTFLYLGLFSGVTWKQRVFCPSCGITRSFSGELHRFCRSYVYLPLNSSRDTSLLHSSVQRDPKRKKEEKEGCTVRGRQKKLRIRSQQFTVQNFGTEMGWKERKKGSRITLPSVVRVEGTCAATETSRMEVAFGSTLIPFPILSR